MIIHNDNNIPAVAEFAQAYSERIEQMYSTIEGLDIYCVDMDENNIPREFSMLDKSCFDSPYCTDLVNGWHFIFRSVAVCANYTKEEEMALLAHEFGHIILAVAGIKLWHSVMDEIFCDNMAHSLDLSDYIIDALDKMANGGYKKASEIADRKIIAASIKTCKYNIPVNNPMGPLNDFLTV